MAFAEGYRKFFKVARRNVGDHARGYLNGLLSKAPRKNMERMIESLPDLDYQSQQQFLSDSPWDHRAVMDQVARDTDAIFGGVGSVLVIDESGLSKKGDKSAGVARQYNGRLGKVDNCQVGVFAALCDSGGGGLVDARLYLPQEWVDDRQRCLKAKVPLEEIVKKTKPQIALEMIQRAAGIGLRFGWVAFDAGYGSAWWLLRAIDAMGVKFVGDVKSDAVVHLSRRSAQGGGKGTTVVDYFDKLDPKRWRKVKVRAGSRGEMEVAAARERVWIGGDGESGPLEVWAVCVVDVEAGETKFFLSNAPTGTGLAEMVRARAGRFWIERCFQDGKTSLGMAQYEARGWVAWHHHMAMVLMAMLFPSKERREEMAEIELLSARDVVEFLEVVLPRRPRDVEEVYKLMLERHKRRRQAIESHARRKIRRPIEI